MHPVPTDSTSRASDKPQCSQSPWLNIGTDFMEWDNQRYLLIVDYFSKYPFLFQISSTTVIAVIGHLTELFAHEGVPLEIFTDNGQPFNPEEWYA